MLSPSAINMKSKLFAPVITMLLMVGLGSCQKDQSNTPDPELASKENATTLASKATLSGVGSNGINLGVAGNFAILSKTGITSVYKSTITGDIGTSPITGAAMVVNCGEVTGNVYSVDAAGPACKTTSATMLTAAIGDLQTAYTDAAGRSNPNFLNLGAGTIGGKTLTPGLYKFTSSVNIPTDIAIAGGPNDVWIFQVAGTLNMSSGVKITLSGGAQAKNIYWQVSDAVTLGTTSHFEGIILGKTGIHLKTGASINGRLLAQTAVTLQMSTVTKPQ
jgi:hypothetical protein